MKTGMAKVQMSNRMSCITWTLSTLKLFDFIPRLRPIEY